MNAVKAFWQDLNTPDRTPGFTTRKLQRFILRLTIFVLATMVVTTIIGLLGYEAFLRSSLGTLIIVVTLTALFYRFLTVDRFVAPPPSSTATALLADQKVRIRRKEKNRYAGVRKAPPRSMGGRR